MIQFTIIIDKAKSLSLFLPQSIFMFAVHSHPAEEWPRVRGGWEAGPECSRDSPDGGEDEAGGPDEGHDGECSPSLTGDILSVDYYCVSFYLILQKLH